MFEFTEGERAYLKEVRAITTDAQGRELLVGLTLEETALYVAHSRAALTGTSDRNNDDTYLKLHDKHERARLEVIGMEHYLRTEKPSRQ